MSLTTIDDVRSHLNLSDDDDELALLSGKIAAADEWIAKYLGRPLSDFDDEVPAPLQQAALQLVGHFYENREATLVGVSVEVLPFGVYDLLAPYREYVF